MTQRLRLHLARCGVHVPSPLTLDDLKVLLDTHPTYRTQLLLLASLELNLPLIDSIYFSFTSEERSVLLRHPFVTEYGRRLSKVFTSVGGDDDGND